MRSRKFARSGEHEGAIGANSRSSDDEDGEEDHLALKEYLNGANSIARLERLVTIDEDMPFEVPWLVGELPPELQAAEEEDEMEANSVGRRRILPRLRL